MSLALIPTIHGPPSRALIAARDGLNTSFTVRCSPIYLLLLAQRETIGTGVHIAASVAHPTQDVSVKLDDGHFIPQPGNGHYHSPVLADGRHTVTYAIGNVSLIPVFDYLTVEAGTSTPLNGSTLIVDDSDTAIKYSGDWTTSPPHPLSFDYSTSLYKNTTHWSSTVGDTIEFKFTGPYF